MNRSNKTSATFKVDVAELLDHELTFEYYIPSSEKTTKEVVATAKRKNVEGANFISMPHDIIKITKKVGESTIVQCPQGTSKELLDAMEAECLAIINGEVA